MTEHQDINGNPCSLDKLCVDEPAWAANRIRAELAKVESLTTKVARLTSRIDAYADTTRTSIEYESKMEKRIERLTADVSALQTVANYARDFVEQYKVVIQSDEYKGIWVFLNVHNNEYKGPIFRDPEYLIAALAAVSGSPDPCDTCRDQVLPENWPEGNTMHCRDCYREIIATADSRRKWTKESLGKVLEHAGMVPGDSIQNCEHGVDVDSTCSVCEFYEDGPNERF